MKKKIFSFMFSLCVLLPCLSALAGCGGIKQPPQASMHELFLDCTEAIQRIN